MTKKIVAAGKTQGLAKSPKSQSSLATTLPLIAVVMNDGFKALAKYLSTPLTKPEMAEVFDQLKVWEEDFEALAKNARDSILALIKADGQKVTDTGTLRLEVGGWKLEAQPQRTGYDAKKVEAFLRGRQMDPANYMDAEITYKVNPGKLLVLIQSGKLSEAEAETLKHDLSYRVIRPKRVD